MLKRVLLSVAAISIVCLFEIAFPTLARRACADAQPPPLVAATAAQVMPGVVPDGAGGMFTACYDRARGGVYAQRLTPDGYAAPGWPNGGLLIQAGYRDNVSIVSDGAGGAYIAFDTGDWYGSVGLSHIGQSAVSLATLTAGDPKAGFSTSSDSSGVDSPQKNRGGDSHPMMAPDGAGGVFYAWTHSQLTTDYSAIQRFTATAGGGVTAVWPSAPYVALWSYFPVLAADGQGGVFVACTTGQNYQIVVDHLTSTGALATGWNGAQGICPATIGQAAPGIVSDGVGGAIIAWADSRDSTHDQIFAQRVTGDGQTVWPASGICVCSQRSDFGPNRFGWYGAADGRHGTLVADGSGGVLAAWVDHRTSEGTSADIYAQRVTAGGAVASGWPVDGAAISAAAGDQLLPAIAPDGRGGAFVAWQDGRSQPSGRFRPTASMPRDYSRRMSRPRASCSAPHPTPARFRWSRRMVPTGHSWHGSMMRIPFRASTRRISARAEAWCQAGRDRP